ncbi:MAG: hypothetical protein DHS20C16_19430 [Phycisphaerae bacterium]|nr:MAG: hypothetical protein DHS20C16_19430 [Phycisphaerae bacterium]
MGSRVGRRVIEVRRKAVPMIESGPMIETERMIASGLKGDKGPGLGRGGARRAVQYATTANATNRTEGMATDGTTVAALIAEETEETGAMVADTTTVDREFAFGARQVPWRSIELPIVGGSTVRRRGATGHRRDRFAIIDATRNFPRIIGIVMTTVAFACAIIHDMVFT